MKKLIAIVFASILISCNAKNEKAEISPESESINSIEEVQKETIKEQAEQTVAEKKEASRLDSLRQVKEHGHAH